jgi:hypothetical protein
MMNLAVFCVISQSCSTPEYFGPSNGHGRDFSGKQKIGTGWRRRKMVDSKSPGPGQTWKYLD